jgi:hypothetical protein
MTKPIRETRPIADFDDRLGIIPLTRLDQVVLASILGFVALCVVYAITTYGTASLYLLLRTVHHYYGYFALVVALVMFGLSLYIGLRRHADVTPYFRRATYIVFAMMLSQGALGLAMVLGFNVQPGEDVHYIYAAGTMAALPFFIFVEKTAEKRPAMGSYMWGFALLAGIIIRCISTGAMVA